MLILFAVIVLLTEVAITWAVQSDQPSVVTFRLIQWIRILLFGLVFWRYRPDELLSANAAGRLMWSIWIGYICSCVVLGRDTVSCDRPNSRVRWDPLSSVRGGNRLGLHCPRLQLLGVVPRLWPGLLRSRTPHVAGSGWAPLEFGIYWAARPLDHWHPLTPSARPRKKPSRTGPPHHSSFPVTFLRRSALRHLVDLVAGQFRSRSLDFTPMTESPRPATRKNQRVHVQDLSQNFGYSFGTHSSTPTIVHRQPRRSQPHVDVRRRVQFRWNGFFPERYCVDCRRHTTAQGTAQIYVDGSDYDDRIFIQSMNTTTGVVTHSARTMDRRRPILRRHLDFRQDGDAERRPRS